MKLITKQSLVDSAASRYYERNKDRMDTQVCLMDSRTHGQVHAQLCEAATGVEIEIVVGHPYLTWVACDECNTHADTVVQVVGEGEHCVSHLCIPCIEKALALARETG